MSSRRTLVSLEFLSRDGVRLELDADGWRLINPRQLGAKALEQARELLEQAEACVPPPEAGAMPGEEPTVQAIGEYAAGKLGLRINHHRFRKHG